MVKLSDYRAILHLPIFIKWSDCGVARFLISEVVFYQKTICEEE